MFCSGFSRFLLSYFVSFVSSLIFSWLVLCLSCLVLSFLPLSCVVMAVPRINVFLLQIRMGRKPTENRCNAPTKPMIRGVKQVYACKVVVSKPKEPVKSCKGTKRQGKTQEYQAAKPSTKLGSPVPLKIVKGTDSDDDEVDHWLLSHRIWDPLVLPPGWVFHPDFLSLKLCIPPMQRPKVFFYRMTAARCMGFTYSDHDIK